MKITYPKEKEEVKPGRITVKGVYNHWMDKFAWLATKWKCHLFTHHSEWGHKAGGVYWPQCPIYSYDNRWSGDILLGDKKAEIQIIVAKISPALTLTIEQLQRYATKGSFVPHFKFVSSPSSWNKEEIDQDTHFWELDQVTVQVN